MAYNPLVERSTYQPFPMASRRRAQAWRHHPAYRRPRHFHAEAELNLVVRGAGTFELGRSLHLVGPGALLWFPRGMDHYLAEASPDFELHVIGFAPSLLDAFAREHGRTPVFTRAPSHANIEPMRHWCEKLSEISDGVESMAVEQRLLSLLDEIAAADDARPSLGGRATALLLEQPELDRDALARKLTSNRGDVSRYFRREQGLSLSEYRNRIYVLRFLNLLELGRTNLTHAAFEAGFGSYSQCHRVVRDLLGHSPRDLRNSELRVLLANRLEPMSFATGPSVGLSGAFRRGPFNANW